MHKILKRIITSKKKALQKQSPRLFYEAVTQTPGIAVIGELKFASPTDLHIGNPLDLTKKALAYKDSGVAAISIITEKEYFKGDIASVKKIKNALRQPVLQKDFVIDASQIYEATQVGSDALLLIARIVSLKTLCTFVSLSQKLGIEPVVEIANVSDLDKAVLTKTRFIAVNARDLDTFTIDIDAACLLLKKIPSGFIKLGFSGIQSSAEVEKYKNAGVRGVLIGTSLMKAENTDKFLREVGL